MTDAERARYLAILGRPGRAIEDRVWMEHPCTHVMDTACPVCGSGYDQEEGIS